jgi:bleomycin hydrolase
VIAMVKTYGIVPAESYTGLVDGEVVHNHGEVFKVVEDLVKRYAQDVSDPRWLRGIAGLVDGFLGTAPTTVKVNGVDVTPLEYARDHLKIPVNDYVEVMSFNYAPFYEKAQLLVPDNWMMYGDYLNLPIDDFMSNFEAAVRNGYSVAIDLDVSEDTYRPGEGLAQLTADLEKPGAITQEVREQLFMSRKTTDDHLIHVVGIVKDKDGKRLFLAKDSWGANHGRLKGHRVLTENYVRAKVLAYMVHKDALIRR